MPFNWLEVSLDGPKLPLQRLERTLDRLEVAINGPEAL